jgi:hypothetical protein
MKAETADYLAKVRTTLAETLKRLIELAHLFASVCFEGTSAFVSQRDITAAIS